MMDTKRTSTFIAITLFSVGVIYGYFYIDENIFNFDQDEYVPTSSHEDGRVLQLVYIGSRTCPICTRDNVKSNVKSVQSELIERAKKTI